MIEVEITEDMKLRAWEKSKEMGVINNSIMKGDGNVAGFLGEEVANSVLRGIIVNTYDYDIVTENLCGNSQQVTWDVKTKRCTSPPKPHYECSIANYNTEQKCDYYIFVRIMWKGGKAKRAWILGYKSKNEYFQEAKFLKKGEVDRSNNFTVRADCYNLAIKDLDEIHTT